MIKICSESVTMPLKIIFEESLKKGIFPEIWKKANVVPVPFQSGFLPVDSCIAQLLSIIHEIQTAFDSSLTVDVRPSCQTLSNALEIRC